MILCALLCLPSGQPESHSRHLTPIMHPFLSVFLEDLETPPFEALGCVLGVQ